jgi:hypothetical protein
MRGFPEYMNSFADVDCALGFDLAVMVVGKSEIRKRDLLHLIGYSHNSPFLLRNYSDFSDYIKTIVN